MRQQGRTEPITAHNNKKETMDINISILAGTDAFPYAHSQAEGGPDAGNNSWKNAMSGPRPLLQTPEEFAEARDWFADFGAWSRSAINGWSRREVQALLLQFIAGDIREAGARKLEDIDWPEYEANGRAGLNTGRLFRGDNGQFFFTIGN